MVGIYNFADIWRLLANDDGFNNLRRFNSSRINYRFSRILYFVFYILNALYFMTFLSVAFICLLLYTCVFAYIYIYLYIYLSIYISINLTISIYLSMYLSIYPSISLLFYPCIHLLISLSKYLF